MELESRWLQTPAHRLVLVHFTPLASEALYERLLRPSDVSSAHPVPSSLVPDRYRPDHACYSEGLDGMQKRIKIGLVAVGVTYVATILSILLGCQPFHKNWQINPDPGSTKSFNPPLHRKDRD